jgi:hypothetical protein
LEFKGQGKNGRDVGLSFLGVEEPKRGAGLEAEVFEALHGGPHLEARMGAKVIVVKGPAVQFLQKVLEGDRERELPEELPVIGLMEAFDFAVELFDARRDELVKDVEGFEVHGERVNGGLVCGLAVEAVRKFESVIGLNAFDGEGSGFHQASDKIQGRVIAEVPVGVGEAPASTVIDGGEEIGLFAFDQKGDVFDIELKALSGAVQLIPFRVSVGFLSSALSQRNVLSPKRFVHAVGRDVIAGLPQMPSEQSGPVMKLLSKRKDGFLFLSRNRPRMGVRTRRAGVQRLGRKGSLF